MLCRYRFAILLISIVSQWKRNSTQLIRLNSFDKFIDLVSSKLTHCHVKMDDTRKHRSSIYSCAAVDSDWSNRVCLNTLNFHDDNQNAPCGKTDHDFTVSVAANKSSSGENTKKPRTSSREFLAITIDAQETYFVDFDRIQMKSPLWIEFNLDLSGLNTLHKSEIIMGAVKAINHYLKRRGWVLIRSSVKRTELQEYFTQETLQRLSFHTMWVVTQ